jgi:hypothetical protein
MIDATNRMRQTVERMDRLFAGPIATGEGAMPALLDLRDLARDEQTWVRTMALLGEVALQYRLLMASIEIHASRCIGYWPDDPDDNRDARRLGEIMGLLLRDFRAILDEHDPDAGPAKH